MRSAIRKSVKVSWAFVGTPFSAVLYPKTEKDKTQVEAKNIHLLRSKYSRQSGTLWVNQQTHRSMRGWPKIAKPNKKEVAWRKNVAGMTYVTTTIGTNGNTSRNRCQYGNG